jgi:hypothetical protein
MQSWSVIQGWQGGVGAGAASGMSIDEASSDDAAPASASGRVSPTIAV